MHLSAEFEPGEEWEQFTFEGTSDRSDERAGLFIWFAPDGPGTLWVDDVSVVEGGPRVLELPLPTGNVVPNASFEMALERDWRSRHVRPTLDETRPLHGGRSLRWDLDGQADQLVTRLIEFGGQGKPFTLELAARAEGSATIEASVWPAVMVGASGPLLRLEAVPKADWGVFRSTGPLPSNRNGSYFLTVDVRPKGKARVWLDAVRLAPGDGSDPFRCSKPIEASLACPKLAHIHREGEAVRLGRACILARGTCQTRRQPVPRASMHALPSLPRDGLLAAAGHRGAGAPLRGRALGGLDADSTARSEHGGVPCGSGARR
jgi:hypothetical protein